MRDTVKDKQEQTETQYNSCTASNQGEADTLNERRQWRDGETEGGVVAWQGVRDCERLCVC